jgi:hypothetical protein
MPMTHIYVEWKPLVDDFCRTFLEHHDEEEIELDRLIDAVEIGTGICSPFLIEQYLYANKFLVEDERIKNATLDL